MIWILALAASTAALTVTLLLDPPPVDPEPQPRWLWSPPPWLIPWIERGTGPWVALMALIGLVGLLLASYVPASALVGGACLALAWGLRSTQETDFPLARVRQAQQPALWIQMLVLVTAAGAFAIALQAAEHFGPMYPWSLNLGLAGALFGAALIELFGRIERQLPDRLRPSTHA